MNKYYDPTPVPKESELDPEEFQTRLESWANYKMFNGVKMRKNGDWYAFYNDIIDGPHETSVAAAKKWDDLCYANEHKVNILNFPEKYWMKGEELPNTNFYNPERKDKKVEWVAPTAKRVKQYDIEVKKGKPLSLRDTMKIVVGEGGLNIRVLNLKNHSSIAEWMLFVTGSSLAHEKRIGDTIVHYLGKRELKNIPIRVTDRDTSEWMVVDGDSVITNIFSPRYRVARDLEDQWELMRPGKNRYENWTDEQLQERFGNIEDKMEAMSLESIIQQFQEKVEKDNQVNTTFQVSDEEISSLKSEIEKEKQKEEEMAQEALAAQEAQENEESSNMEEEEVEWEKKDYYITKEDFERLKNGDGTITINGERLVIEDICDVTSDEIEEEVPFLEIDEKPKKKEKKNHTKKHNKK